MAELLSLKQTGKVFDYHDQFETLLGRVDLTENYVASFFNGLKSSIQQLVCMFMPKTLSQAYALAHLQKTTLKSIHQELNINSKRLPPLLPTPNPLPKPPLRTIFTHQTNTIKPKITTYPTTYSNQF